MQIKVKVLLACPSPPRDLLPWEQEKVVKFSECVTSTIAGLGITSSGMLVNSLIT